MHWQMQRTHVNMHRQMQMQNMHRQLQGQRLLLTVRLLLMVRLLVEFTTAGDEEATPIAGSVANRPVRVPIQMMDSVAYKVPTKTSGSSGVSIVAVIRASRNRRWFYSYMAM